MNYFLSEIAGSAVQLFSIYSFPIYFLAFKEKKRRKIYPVDRTQKNEEREE